MAGINFSLAQGEILGLAAVSGNGQSELVEVLVGWTTTEGSITLKETEITTAGVEERWRAGLAYIPPQDRRGRGTAPPWLTLARNIAIRGYFEPPP